MDNGQIDYRQLFSVPMWASIACLIALLAAYPRKGKQERTGAEPAQMEAMASDQADD